MYLFDQLRNLGLAVKDEFPMINRGGCCVYAALVGEALARKDMAVQGIVCMGYVAAGLDIDKVRPLVKDVGSMGEWCANGIYFNHVGLEFMYDYDDYHYDTDNLQHADAFFAEMKVVPGRLSLQEMIWLAAKREGWNSCFRRTDIPKIKRMVKKYLK